MEEIWIASVGKFFDLPTTLKMVKNFYVSGFYLQMFILEFKIKTFKNNY